MTSWEKLVQSANIQISKLWPHCHLPISWINSYCPMTVSKFHKPSLRLCFMLYEKNPAGEICDKKSSSKSNALDLPVNLLESLWFFVSLTHTLSLDKVRPPREPLYQLFSITWWRQSASFVPQKINSTRQR